MGNTDLMTLSELCTAVVFALATGYSGTGSERTRDLPDVRTIRYYTTLGLLDRPASFQGRTAYYGRKHLLQLVAIKRLQAKGFTLSQIQSQLMGISLTNLEQLANITLADKSPIEVAKPKKTGSARAVSFWKEPPSPVENPSPTEKNTIATLQGIPLGSDVTLLLPVLRSLDAHDLEGLQVVAQPLLQWLKQRRILDDSTQ